jgi:hypothetical protein
MGDFAKRQGNIKSIDLASSNTQPFTSTLQIDENGMPT